MNPTETRDHARQDAAERRGAALPLEVGAAVPPRQLELQVLDRQVGGADDDERADDDDDEVDAVRQHPVDEAAADPTAAR